jgi:hypothetical protein
MICGQESIHGYNWTFYQILKMGSSQHGIGGLMARESHG